MDVWFFTSFALTYVFALCCDFSALGVSRVFPSLSGFFFGFLSLGLFFFLVLAGLFISPTICSLLPALVCAPTHYSSAFWHCWFLLFLQNFFWGQIGHQARFLEVLWLFTVFLLPYSLSLCCGFSAFDFYRVFSSSLGFSLLGLSFLFWFFLFWRDFFLFPSKIVFSFLACPDVLFSHYSSAN